MIVLVLLDRRSIELAHLERELDRVDVAVEGATDQGLHDSRHVILDGLAREILPDGDEVRVITQPLVNALPAYTRFDGDRAD